MNRCKKMPGDLTPIDTLTRDQCSPEWDKLDKALSSDNITNIAVSSSYGMGKTSFLKSYFKHNFDQKKPAKYRFISVPSFTSESDQSEIHLEKSIINQLSMSLS